MKPGRPLRRRKPLQARAGIRKTSRLNPVSEKQRAKLDAAGEAARRDGGAFRAAIKGERCIVCGRSEREAYEQTGWGHEAHHGIPRATLKRLGLLELLWEPGNAVATCQEPCHRRHTQRYRRICRRELPARVVAFASSRPELRLAFELEYPG